MVVLFDTLLPLAILVISRVGWVTFTPARTHISDVTVVLSSASANVVSSHVTLTAAVVMAISISRVETLSDTSSSSQLVIPPGLSQVIFLIPAATALLSPILPLF